MSYEYRDFSIYRNIVFEFVEKEANLVRGTIDDNSIENINLKLNSGFNINKNNLLQANFHVSSYQLKYNI